VLFFGQKNVHGVRSFYAADLCSVKY